MLQSLYKQSIDRNERQEIRRKELLQQQKLKRLEQLDEQRQFSAPIEKRDRLYYRKHKNTDIANIQLQFSEWLKEKPEDLNDWFLVPCPKGQRCLVVATKGETKMFSKNKRYRMTFSSLLPGGGKIGSNIDSCILDCIYNNDLDTFYVLDVLHYSIPLMNCDAEFRFFWLKSKFAELEDLAEKYENENLKNFLLLDCYDMGNMEQVAIALQSYPLWPHNQTQLDGFLFYHKKSHYVCGSTPLVCWLFPFMVPDILQIPISSSYQPPENYCKQNPWQYMEEFDKNLARKHCRRKPKQKENMDQYESTVEMDLTMEEDYEFGEKDEENSLLDSILTAEKMLELEGNSQ